jgi:hypothetical protein
MRCHLPAAVAVGLLLCSSQARADDAAQRLESPLSPGSGVTFAASKRQDSLTIGLASQMSGGLYLQGAIAGKVEDKESASLFSLASGVTPGVAVKLGIGYSSFQTTDTSRYEAACKRIIDRIREKAKKERDDTCRAKATELVGFLDLKVADVPAASCKAAVVDLLNQYSARTAAQAASPAPAGSAPTPAAALRGSTIRALEDLADSSLDDSWAKAARTARQLIALLRPEPDEGEEVETKSCEDQVAESDDPEIKELYQKEVRPVTPSGPFVKLTANALGEVKQYDYRPVDSSGKADLANAQQLVPFLPGASVDLAVFYRAWTFGSQIGYARSTHPSVVEICDTTTQGTFSTRNCGTGVIGKPRLSDSMFVGAAVQLNPISMLAFGDLVPGAEFLIRVTSTSGRGMSLLAGHSFETGMVLPIFVGGKDAPNGLRAGLAPELTIPSASDAETDFTIQMFVGTKFPAS